VIFIYITKISIRNYFLIDIFETYKIIATTDEKLGLPAIKGKVISKYINKLNVMKKLLV
jgi:hypothetical protein